MNFIDKIIPTSVLGSAITSVLITVAVAFMVARFSIEVLAEYGMGLFFLVPFSVGVLAPILRAYHLPISRKESINVALLSLIILGAAFMIFAIEGVICLVMSLPLVIPLNILGAILGYEIQKKRKRTNLPAFMFFFLFIVPGLMLLEKENKGELTPIALTTSIEVEAPIEEVWKNVIEFGKMEAPNEWLFKTGIAYPIDAHIEGHGEGAIRYCNFSTGSFVEPITKWEAPHLLQFTVKEQPIPMKELSFYDELSPPHLHGYFVSKKGEFKLSTPKDGITLVEGTTWYVHYIHPTFYWSIWSDHIIHSIHERVLNHIKVSSEK